MNTLNLRDYAPACHLLDGAWGTELEQHGLLSGKVPELLNAENPAAIEAIARSYVEVGSEIILTNTFGANRFVLERHDASERVEELVVAGVDISRKAADGKTRYPVGPEEFASYVPQFIEAGVTFLGGCCGTTPSHILAARKALINHGEEIGRNQ